MNDQILKLTYIYPVGEEKYSKSHQTKI
ncbi:MAG: hypothetical protein ACI93R_003810, partial [Flavobacteriales bacterium]